MVEDARKGHHEINGEHKPKASSGVPKTHPKWACITEDIKICVILTPTDRSHDMYTVRDINMIGKPD